MTSPVRRPDPAPPAGRKTMIRLPRMLLGLGATLTGAGRTGRGPGTKLKIGTRGGLAFARVLPNGDRPDSTSTSPRRSCAEMKVECTIVNRAYDGADPRAQREEDRRDHRPMSITPEREKARLLPAIIRAGDVSGPGLGHCDHAGRPRKFVGRPARHHDGEICQREFLQGDGAEPHDTLEAAGSTSPARVDVVLPTGSCCRFSAARTGRASSGWASRFYDPEMLGIGAGIGIRQRRRGAEDQSSTTR